MAEGSPESISAEAFQRVVGERDALKAQAVEAAKAFADLKIERKLAEHYGTKGYANPLAVASKALADLRAVPDEEFAAKADEWYEAQRRLFAPAPTPEPTEPASTPPPSSPWEKAAATPIPSGGKVPATGTPLVAGTPEFVAWVKGKTLDQVRAAKLAGDVVIPDKVVLAQGSVF